MSEELLYTSAPKGLLPGSGGFCTVAMTREMSPALTAKLESLSAYRAPLGPAGGNAANKQAVYSHVTVKIGGTTYHVLSRIGAAGLDYTERPNKLAHHVALESGELPPGGPAWVLSRPGFMQTAWDGQVGYLSNGRVPPTEDPPARVCSHWQTLAGDAGWAGVLAEAFLKNPSQPVYLLCPPQAEPLHLVAEALSLIPAERRWDVTFSTSFAGLTPGIGCGWRCVSKSATDQKDAARPPNAMVLDLTGKLGRAQGGLLVDQARTGHRAVPGLDRQGVARTTNALGDHAEHDAAAGSSAVVGRAAGVHPKSGLHDDMDHRSAHASGRGSPSRAASSVPPPPPLRAAKFKSPNGSERRWRWLPFALGTLTGVLVAAGIGVALLYFGWPGQRVAQKDGGLSQKRSNEADEAVAAKWKQEKAENQRLLQQQKAENQRLLEQLESQLKDNGQLQLLLEERVNTEGRSQAEESSQGNTKTGAGEGVNTHKNKELQELKEQTARSVQQNNNTKTLDKNLHDVLGEALGPELITILDRYEQDKEHYLQNNQLKNALTKWRAEQANAEIEANQELVKLNKQIEAAKNFKEQAENSKDPRDKESSRKRLIEGFNLALDMLFKFKKGTIVANKLPIDEVRQMCDHLAAPYFDDFIKEEKDIKGKKELDPTSRNRADELIRAAEKLQSNIDKFKKTYKRPG